MDVIIVAKTHMSNAICVGGVLANGRLVRLLNENGYNQDSDTKIEIGEVYTISFSERVERKPPHTEDILVHSMAYKFTFDSIEKMVRYLTSEINIRIWKGSSDVLFDGKLLWTSGGSGYISKSGEIPDNSVGFWIPDKDLNRKDFNEKVRYSYPLRWRNISFVGCQNPVDKIPAGTLVRVSLARWWSPNDDEERCYLQLSGWYGLPDTQHLDYKIEANDDLPF